MDPDGTGPPSPARFSARLRDGGDPDFWIGRTVGGFRVVRRIGSGGMGDVFEATQESPRRTVALKILRSATASLRAMRRFEIEAEVLAKLRHSGIACIHQAGIHPGAHGSVAFFAMELVTGGESIASFAARRSLDVRARLDIFHRVCDAVHHAHLNGVIHRDVKPDNILVDSHGQPKIIDFGVARVTGPEAQVTAATVIGEVIGTLPYMSPEQCLGDPDDIDARTDVYSLGAVLYELLCGRPPHDLDGLLLPQALRRIREEEPERPSIVRRELKGNVEAIVLKAIEKDRRKRYHSAAALASDIRRHLAGDTIEARPPTVYHRLAKRVARHPIATTAVTCVAVALLVLGPGWLGFLWIRYEPRDLVVLPGNSAAQLRSIRGDVLHEWTTEMPNGVFYAFIVQRPDEFGGGRVAVIGYGLSSAIPGLAGEVAVYDLDDPEEPIWTTAESPLSLPEGVGPKPGGAFNVGHVRSMDVLEESPGSELLVVQSLDPHSQTAVRVFDLSGRLRFLAWHDGGVFDMAFLPSARILAVSGLNSEKTWQERAGITPAGHHAFVVFGLAVRDGHVARDRFVALDGRVLDDSLAFYRWLGPPEMLTTIGRTEWRIRPGLGSKPTGRHLNVAVAFPPGADGVEPMIEFTLDEGGNEVLRTTNDWFKMARQRGELFDESLIELIPYEDLPLAR